MNIGKETELIEFKKSTSEIKEGIISISSILNKHQKGTLYFGVKDSGEVVGQEIGKDTERKISREIADNIRPAFWYQVLAKQSNDGKTFIEIFFSGENVPYSAYGKYYERFADEDKQISDIELERLFASRQKDYSEWEAQDSEESIGDVDLDRLKKTIDDGNESGRIQYEYTDPASIMSKLGLYSSKTERITNAGRVLFSKNRPVLLKTAVYATSTKETFIKLNHFEGNIFECIDEGIAFILSSINWKVNIVGSAKRVETPEIPQRAIREMVVNAFAHGCYFANTSFAIEIFSDRVTIYSPGSFPAGYKPEDFADNAAEPIMLNPKIVNVLFKADVIESFGTGFERTFKDCREAKVSCAYENTLSGFRFTFYRKEGKAKEALSKTEKEIYDLLKETDYLTNDEISKRIDKTTKTVGRVIKSLKEKGYIQKEGSGSDSYWKLLK